MPDAGPPMMLDGPRGIHIAVYPDRAEWTGGAAVCVDGSPNAYKIPPARGLDLLANAYRDPHEHPANPLQPASGWVGVLTADGTPNGQPVLQVAGDPCPGGLVSPTAGIADPTRHAFDPRRYHDAETVRYIVVPAKLLTKHGGPFHLGDRASVSYKGVTVDAIVGEVGPGCCEVSVAVAKALGIPASPINGGVDGGVSYVVTLNSASPST